MPDTPAESAAAVLRRAAEALSAGPADLTVECPDVDACVADLMRKHALLLDHCGSYTDTARLVAMARAVLGGGS